MEFSFAGIYYPIIALLCAMIFMGWFAAAFPEHPILFVAKRWLRLCFFTAAIGVFLEALLPGHPLWSRLAIAALAYVFVESLLYWLQIWIMSCSQYDIFAPYKEVETAWSAQKKHILIKNAILGRGFVKSGSFKSEPIEGIEIMSTYFDSPDRLVRLGVAFIPYAGISLMASNVISITKDGKSILTEASSSPSGLPYPENCLVRRHPLVGSPLKLIDMHLKRVKDMQLQPISYSTSEMLKLQLAEFKKSAVEGGFVYPDPIGDDGETLTPEGKYRVWVDTIFVNYLPFLIK